MPFLLLVVPVHAAGVDVVRALDARLGRESDPVIEKSEAQNQLNQLSNLI